MNPIFDFTIAAVVISASGVLAPGPLFATNLVFGMKEGTKAGIKIAVGHTIVEFPLIIFLGIGVFSLDVFPQFRTIITIAGASVLFIFAGLQIKSILYKKELPMINKRHGAITAGVILSALNPFFIVWWLSVGFKLISDAIIIWTFWGTLVLFVVHVWMDFVWLGTTAYFAKKSSKIISNKIYRLIMLVLSLTLVYFGIVFVRDFLTTI